MDSEQKPSRPQGSAERLGSISSLEFGKMLEGGRAAVNINGKRMGNRLWSLQRDETRGGQRGETIRQSVA